MAGEVLYYLSDSGVMAYGGGVPQSIGGAFGTERFSGGVAGSDGLKYYISMMDASGKWGLYVYDTRKGLWHREDDTHALGFAMYDGRLYCLDAEGRILILRGEAPEEDCEEEAEVKWFAEFADFTEDDPNRKGIGKIQIRLELEKGASVQVLLQTDSDGVWRKVKEAIGTTGKRSFYLPIVPRRADHYRIRLEGTGMCRIHSLTRETYSGSELP